MVDFIIWVCFRDIIGRLLKVKGRLTNFFVIVSAYLCKVNCFYYYYINGSLNLCNVYTIFFLNK